MSGRPVRSDAAQVRPVLARVFRGYRVPLIDIGLRPGLRLVWLQRFPEGRSGLIAWLRCAGLDVVTVPGLDPAQEEIEGSGRYLAEPAGPADLEIALRRLAARG